jgi:hypothetical protein
MRRGFRASVSTGKWKPVSVFELMLRGFRVGRCENTRTVEISHLSSPCLPIHPLSREKGANARPFRTLQTTTPDE